MATQKYLVAIHAAAYAYTAWRLFAHGLAARQQALVWFLVSRCMVMAVMSVLPPKSRTYFWTYMVSMPIDWAIMIVAVREAIGLVLKEYPGVQTFGRWILLGAVAVAVLASTVIVATYWRGTAAGSNLYYIQVATQSLVFGLAVVVTSLLIFMSHFPLGLPRNRLVSSIAFATVILGEAITLFVDSLSKRLNAPLFDLPSVVFGTVCVVVWGALLKPAGAEVTPKRPRSEKDQRLLQQLASMERLLGGIGRTRI